MKAIFTLFAVLSLFAGAACADCVYDASDAVLATYTRVHLKAGDQAQVGLPTENVDADGGTQTREFDVTEMGPDGDIVAGHEGARYSVTMEPNDASAGHTDSNSCKILKIEEISGS
jgi:hypothetical protein